MRVLKTSFLIFFLFVIIACTDSFPPEFPAPDFTLKSPVTGKKTTLSEFRGRPVILYWFASW